MIDSICKIIGDQVDKPADAISASTTFKELGMDSLDMIEVIMEVEDRYDVAIADEIFESTRTMSVGEFISKIAAIKGAQHGIRANLQGAVTGRR